MTIQPTSYYQHISQFFYQNRVAAVVTGAALLGIAAYGAVCLYNRGSTLKRPDMRVGPEELKKTYDLKAVLSQLESIKGDNKVSLFIGRRPEEELPVEKGNVWVSGDIDAAAGIPEERIHLWLDFRDAAQLRELHGRFDKIVIDVAVTKFLKGNFVDRFIPLLKKSDESIFVFEPIPGSIGYYSDLTKIKYDFSSLSFPEKWCVDEQEEKLKVFEEYQNRTDQGQQEEDYRLFLEEHQALFEIILPPMTEEDKRLDFMWDIIDKNYHPSKKSKIEEGQMLVLEFAQEYCRKFFQEVAYYESNDYYYPTRVGTIGDEKYGYIVAKGLK